MIFDPVLIIELVNKLHFEFKLNDGVSCIFLNGINIQKEISSTKVSDYVSQISAISEVRKKIVSIQRKFGIKKVGDKIISSQTFLEFLIG